MDRHTAKGSGKLGLPSFRRHSKLAQQSAQTVPVSLTSEGKTDHQGHGITVITRVHAQDHAAKLATPPRHASASWKDRAKSPQFKALPDLPTINVPTSPNSLTSTSPSPSPSGLSPTFRRKPANMTLQTSPVRGPLEGKVRDNQSGNTHRSISDRTRSLPSSSPRRVSLQPIDELTSSGPQYPKHNEPRASYRAAQSPRKISGPLVSPGDITPRTQQKLQKSRPQETGRRSSMTQDIKHSVPAATDRRLSSISPVHSPSTARNNGVDDRPLPPLPPSQVENKSFHSQIAPNYQATNEKIPVESEDIAPAPPYNMPIQLPRKSLQSTARTTNGPNNSSATSQVAPQPQYQDWEIRPLPPLDMKSAIRDIDQLSPPSSPAVRRQTDHHQHEDQISLPQRTHSRGKSSSGLNILNQFMNKPGISSSETYPAAISTTPDIQISPTHNQASSAFSGGSPAPALTDVHFSCFQSHRSMAFSRNQHAPVACMTCHAEDHEPRWRCTWCCLRICRGCLDVLESCDGRAVGELKRRLKI